MSRPRGESRRANVADLRLFPVRADNLPPSLPTRTKKNEQLCKNKGTVTETLAIEYGFWRVSNSSLDFLECPVKSWCWGGYDFTKWRCVVV